MPDSSATRSRGVYDPLQTGPPLFCSKRLFGRVLPGLCGRGLHGFGVAVRAGTAPSDPPVARTSENQLTRIADGRPLLADHPEFVEPVRESVRYEAPLLVNDAKADLAVRALAVFLQRPGHRRNAQPAGRGQDRDHYGPPLGC